MLAYDKSCVVWRFELTAALYFFCVVKEILYQTLPSFDELCFIRFQQFSVMMKLCLPSNQDR